MLDVAESYGQRLPFNCVDYSVIPQKLMLNMVEIARFGGCSNKEILVIASDIDAANRNLGRTQGNWEDAVVKICIRMINCARRSRSA